MWMSLCDDRLEDSNSSTGKTPVKGTNTQRNKLKAALEGLVAASGGTWTSEMVIPRRWELRGDLVLFHTTVFQHADWMAVRDKVGEEQFWRTLAKSLTASRVAIKDTITDDAFRTPRVNLLVGDHGWVTHTDNGIKYTYDVTKCMFSAGNISEKLRVARLRCHGETIVDMYAGIGYFTLPLLVHARATLVHACDWNAHSVEALERTLVLNGVRDRCVVHLGDSALVAPRGVAQRVVLGLIPSSECGWEAACRALSPITGGVLHVHGNVTVRSSAPSQVWAEQVKARMEAILTSHHQPSLLWTVTVQGLRRVKRYAPHIDHIVADLLCSPVKA